MISDKHFMKFRKTTIIVLISLVSFVAATAKEEKSVKPTQSEQLVGKIETVQPDSMTVRVGDAKKTFSFDNKTVFTYGDRRGRVDDMRVGAEVFATLQKGKAAEVNATERIEGIIEKIDAAKKELIVKVGDQLKKIPFRYFLAFSSEGKEASYTDMKVGDEVLLNVNVGFAGQPAATAKKP